MIQQTRRCCIAAEVPGAPLSLDAGRGGGATANLCRNAENQGGKVAENEELMCKLQAWILVIDVYNCNHRRGRIKEKGNGEEGEGYRERERGERKRKRYNRMTKEQIERLEE